MVDWIERHRWLTAIAFVVAAVLSAMLGLGLARDAAPPPAGFGPAPTTTTTATTTTTGTITPTTSSRVPATPPRTTTRSPATTRTAPTTTTPPFPAGFLGQEIAVVPTSRKIVALTFDAGGNSAGLNKILATLASQRVPATFFLTGTWARNNPAGVSQIVAGGHRIGNHTMTHPHLTGMTDAAVTTEVFGAQRAIQATGADPRPLFRFPFGDRNARTIATVNRLGYLPIRWTVDTLGWKGTSGGITARQVTDRVLNSLQPGEIVLMHVGANPDDATTLDADALPGVITALRTRGYDFVTLDILLHKA
jgi:peptidoglycan/xylan/chitin deacetylase (PgdA/CDA1 family)